MIEIDLGSLVLWGLIATAVLTVVMTMAQGLGWSRISLPFMLGTAVTGRRMWAMVIGFGIHFALGVAFGLLYAWTFESLNRSSWWLGLLFGVLHGAFMLTVFIQVLPYIHPRMASKHRGPTPTRQLEPPGFLALNYGRNTPLVTMVAHVLYGLILGALYNQGG